MGHVHAELIKAWLEGEKIQRFDSATNRWDDVEAPRWKKACKYRVKPSEPEVRELYMFAALQKGTYSMIPRFFEKAEDFCQAFSVEADKVKRLDFTKIEITV